MVYRREHVRTHTGLVLGVGGVLGAAWMTGALAAIQAHRALPVACLELIVGTSAGSVLAAALDCGFTVEEMVAHQRGEPAGELSALGSPDLGGGALPPWPRLHVGSPRLLLAALRAPHRAHPWVAASACLPCGRAEHTRLRAMVAGMVTRARRPRRPGRTWLVAVDYDTGRRVVFGRRGAPAAALPDAVTASCSVPGWFRPTVIDGRRYIDGGVRSPASADLLARAGLKEAYVLAPAASLVTDRPRTLSTRVERGIRRLMTSSLRREVDTLRSSGCRVTVLTPGPDDLAAMGANLMDPARRTDVFETSLRTCAQALADTAPPHKGRGLIGTTAAEGRR